jgi:replication factor C subunit 2/4
MASFFDLKARKEAAAANGSAATKAPAKENTAPRPWVEK